MQIFLAQSSKKAVEAGCLEWMAAAGEGGPDRRLSDLSSSLADARQLSVIGACRLALPLAGMARDL